MRLIDRTASWRKAGCGFGCRNSHSRYSLYCSNVRGELVTREEIQQRLWPADTFVAFDDGLNTAIKKLRLTLGDTADNPRFIETVPRRGYRFIAPAIFSTPVAATEAAKPEAAGRALTEQVVITSRETSRVVIESTASRWPRLWVAAVLVIVLAGGAAGYVFWNGHYRAPESAGSIAAGPVRPGAPRPSIAVLGFRNLSRGPEEAWISTALSVMLTTELSSGEQIRIVPGESVARTRTSLLLPDSESFAQDTLARIRKNLDSDYVSKGLQINNEIGDISLQVIGEHAEVKTGSGNISCERIPLGVNAETGEGDISLMVVGPSSATVRRGKGRIDVGGARGSFMGVTAEGDLHVKAIPRDHWQLSSTSGNIRLELPPRTGFELDASTDTGELQLDRDDLTRRDSFNSHSHQNVNNGGPHIIVHSISGNIAVR